MSTVQVDEKWGGDSGAKLYTFSSGSGLLKAKVTNYGATLVSLQIKGKGGKYEECTLGYDSFDEWKKGTSYFGCTVGRYGNRIAKGKFTIDGETFDKLPINNESNSLHGGVNSYDKRIWSSEPVESANCRGVRMTLVSPDGDNGYPGTLKIETYILLDNNDELLFHWLAKTDKKTVVNLTNHSYWNMSGWNTSPSNILDHELTLKCSHYVAVDKESIPTGDLMSVKGTPFDFNNGKKIGDEVNDALMAPQKGYDHTVVFTDGGSESHPAPMDGEWSKSVPRRGKVVSTKTGNGFELFTTEPGVQVYCGNYLEDGHKGYGQKPILHRGGLCLECQHYPDTPNQPGFPSTDLSPSDTYRHTTVHKFFASASSNL
eukprot:TRINITY_DN13579_c2_g1_i1.p1 TRINITY_DN13579_c2_g1~~TRINITY_DN13579_c2_g1_i1.p1  ORF type:complete len:388 (+),score=87.69 TRINITY_DN13579_c2_g1_i1:49-1164(+)